MKGNNSDKGKSAIDIIEEAVHILRTSPFSLLPSYYIGTLPFILCLLYFWADMSRNAFAIKHCTASSMGLAALFIWMKCWHVIFAQRVNGHINLDSASKWTFSRTLGLISTQSLIHATGLFLIPLALIIMVPFGWIYAFYQNLSVQVPDEKVSIRKIIRRSWEQARLCPGQNHIILFILSFFGLVVFINLGGVVLILPYLLKTILGIESVFTISGTSLLNTTFLASVCALTYLCTDPLIKTVYTLRCFYGLSQESGDDIRSDLKRYFVKNRHFAMSLVVILGSLAFALAHADKSNATGYESSFEKDSIISMQELDRSIEETMSQKEFIWRMPRDEIEVEDYEDLGPVGSMIEWLVESVKEISKTVLKWLREVADYLRKLFPDVESNKQKSKTAWMRSAHILLYALLAILLCITAIYFWRTRRIKKGIQNLVTTTAYPDMPDLRDEQISGDELSPNRWLRVAKELMNKGSLQLALRAFYLASLSHLAENEMITIASYKSNRDYEMELRRRTHTHKKLHLLFSRIVTAFDRYWYGMHEVTQTNLEDFIGDQERIMAIV